MSVSTYSDHIYYTSERWPEVVGMDAWRAKRIIRWGNHLHVLCRPLKRSYQLALDSDTDSFTSEAASRVILYLDKDGYVAKTPYIG